MSDLFDEAAFLARRTGMHAVATMTDEVRVVRVEEARAIAEQREKNAVGFAVAPLRSALAQLITLARVAVSIEPNAEARRQQDAWLAQAEQALDESRS